MSVLARAPGRYEDQFRGPRGHKWRWESPHLESRDEYELTHDTGTPHLESRCEFDRRAKTHSGPN
jgi:hypothetical protein